MKRLYRAILFICLSLITLNCQKEINYALHGTGSGNNGSSSPLKATVQGNIVDENGLPAEGVMIQAGSKTAITDADGYFRIINASLDKNTSLITAEKDGYFKAYRSFRATAAANHVLIKLIKKQSAGIISATAGGDVALNNGAKIILPANGVVNANDGSVYTGSISVYAFYIDPSADDIAQMVPGSFMADDKNNKRVTLSSYGMVAVELKSAAGEKLQIAPAAAATLTMPIPASFQSSAPAAIALWYVDEQTGIWKEEGTAVKNGSNYIGEVKHFSFWNCDIPFPAVTLSVTITNAKAVPIVHASVRMTGKIAGSLSQAYGYTDSLGQVNGLVPAGEPLVLEVLDPCNNVIYTKNIGPLNQNTDLGTIAIANSTPSLLTIEGQLKDCSNQLDTKGYVIISYDNTSRYMSVNEKGEFAVSFSRCSGSAASFQIIGIDESVQQQGAAYSIAITTPITNTRTIIACGTSSAQFINYTVDGVDYSITSVTSDSLTAYTAPTQSTPPLLTWINGLKITTNEYVQMVFEHEAAAGSYPLVSLSVQGFDSIIVIQPSNIILTNYPAASGGFYEGTFTAKFKEQSGFATVHNINGSFRIRRF